MKYFVTGATGFIGSVLSRQLAEEGHEVVTIARRPDRARYLVQLGVEVVKGDILEKDSMREAMTGVDGVFHVAGWYKIGANRAETALAEKVNVGGTRNVLELMKELKIKKGVYTSSLAVFSDTRGRLVDERYKYRGPWLTRYDETKWKAHFEVAIPMIEQRLPLVIVQPGLVYGPGDPGSVHTTWQLYLRHKLFATPKRTAFCWSHVEDAAKAHILAMERGAPGETYITGGPMHTLIDALGLAERITGVRAPRLHLHPVVLKTMAAIMRVVGSVVKVPEIYTYEGLRTIAGTTYIGRSDKAAEYLGFAPRPLATGLIDTLQYEQGLVERGIVD